MSHELMPFILRQNRLVLVFPALQQNGVGEFSIIFQDLKKFAYEFIYAVKIERCKKRLMITNDF